ncbi:acyl-CoA Delta(11) desaturase-like [Cloeon dipterum]|uniref:acyl-CoA Delta(11) desaturase-like n=1 Tax=Cloeon dipterum TaxID=197152 RepID=UPI00321FA10E
MPPSPHAANEPLVPLPEDASEPRLPTKEELKKKEEKELMEEFSGEIVWFNAIGFVILHVLFFIGGVRCLGTITTLYPLTQWKTMFWAFFVGFLSAEGVLMGAHRLYSHKAFKANWKLRALLLFWHTVAGQNCMYIWVRDHRLHHKYSDTNADPHNARRGFWYSHVGWLAMKKHPLIKIKGLTIDMSDIERDPLLMFQKNHYKKLYVLCAIFLPVIVPIYFFDEYWLDALLTVYFTRSIIVLNLTWTVNSAAHLWGTKPYDKNIMPRENKWVGMWAFGEGWHNYHHAFPWDYRAAELAVHHSWTTQLIEFFARIGWAYDLKFASDQMIHRRIQRTGDGTDIHGFHTTKKECHDHIEEAEPHPDESAKANNNHVVSNGSARHRA